MSSLSANPTTAYTAGGLSITADPWLSGIMSREVRRVSGMVHKDGESKAQQTMQQVIDRPGFSYACVPPRDLCTSHLLESCGFHLVDTRITLEASGLSDRGMKDGHARHARAEDREAVESIARCSFTFSRFHIDPDIPQLLADEIKTQWAGNYFHGRRGDHMIVAEEAGEVVGFTQLLKTPNNILVIDLMAVKKSHRGQGLAREMIEFSSSCVGEGGFMQVGTQIINTVSLQVYQRLGFRIVSFGYVFHHHRTVL